MVQQICSRRDATDGDRCGRPVTASTTTMVDNVKTFLDEDRRVTLREIGAAFDISTGTAHLIVTEKLNMRRVCARWIPRLITQEQKNERVNISTRCLQKYQHQGQRFLEKIVTVDETWISLFEPETKQESSMWKTPGSPSPKKALVRTSAKKIMFIVFFDIRGVILSHAVPVGHTVTGNYYSKVSHSTMFLKNLHLVINASTLKQVG